MATATARTRTVTKTIEVEEEDGVTLELSNEEAAALHDILRRVGGVPDRSRRGLADNIKKALSDASVPANLTTGHDLEGHLYFS